MFDGRSDRDWKRFGNEDPYFGVISDERFRSANLSAERKAEFHGSGRADFRRVLDVIEQQLVPNFVPARALDFGCGVGRILIPLAELAEVAIGLDVSEGMLAEARKNCADAELDNVEFVLSDDELTGVAGQFDLIHSQIVFQHIPPARGMRILRRLLDRLTPGGVGVVHVTYSTTASRSRVAGKGLLSRVRHALGGRLVGSPRMEMHAYDLADVLGALSAIGVEQCHLETTNHGGELGVVLYFLRPS